MQANNQTASSNDNDNTSKRAEQTGTHENPIRYERLERTDPDYKRKMRAQLDQFGRDAKAGRVLCLSDLMSNAGM